MLAEKEFLTFVRKGGAGGSVGVTDHGALTGLADDDHTQYLLVAPASAARNTIVPSSDIIPVTLKGSSGQTANLLLATDNADAALFNITAAGSIGLLTGVANTGLSNLDLNFVNAGSSAIIRNNTATASSHLSLRSGTGATSSVFIVSSNVEKASFGASTIVFNDTGADVDTRIEGDNEVNLFYLDASTDRIGLADSAPDARLEILGATSGIPLITRNAATTPGNGYVHQNNAGSTLFAISSAGAISAVSGNGLTTLNATDLQLNNPGSSVSITHNTSTASSNLILRAGTGATSNVVIQSSNVERAVFGPSEAVFNDTGADTDFRIEGDTVDNLFYLDAGLEVIGIGTAPVSGQRVKIEGTGTQTCLVIRPPGSGTAQIWQDSSGNTISSVNSAGNFNFRYIATGGVGPSTTISAIISPLVTTNKGLVIRSVTSQTGNLFEIQDGGAGNAQQMAIAANGRDFILDTATGTKWGTGTTQKQGWWNAAPVVQSTGWGSITNVTPDKAYDADTVLVAELADVVGTLIAQLVTYGILGA